MSVSVAMATGRALSDASALLAQTLPGSAEWPLYAACAAVGWLVGTIAVATAVPRQLPRALPLVLGTVASVLGLMPILYLAIVAGRFSRPMSSHAVHGAAILVAPAVLGIAALGMVAFRSRRSSS